MKDEPKVMRKSGSKKNIVAQAQTKKAADNSEYYSLRYTPSVSVDRTAQTALINAKSLRSLTRGATPDRSPALDPRELDFKSMSSDRQL